MWDSLCSDQRYADLLRRMNSRAVKDRTVAARQPSGLAKSHGPTDLSLLVQFHDFDSFSSFRLYMNQQAVNSLVRTEQFDLDVSGKGRQRLSEILPQILFSSDSSGSLAKKFDHKRGLEFYIFGVMREDGLKITLVPRLSPFLREYFGLLGVHWLLLLARIIHERLWQGSSSTRPRRGRYENSPAIHCWEPAGEENRSPRSRRMK